MFTGNCSATSRNTAVGHIAAAGKSYWIKVKKRKHPTIDRVAEFVSLGLARIKGARHSRRAPSLGGSRQEISRFVVEPGVPKRTGL
jgi:hypothetical protein